MPEIFASTGSPARIGGVHVDTITVISRDRGFDRTTNALEQGAPLTVHRRRKPERMTIQLVASDVEPIFGASLTPLWESSHASKVERRLQEAMQGSTELEIWTGDRFLRTPEGVGVWVIDDISDTLTAPERGVYRATLEIGESRRAQTAFTSALDNVAAGLADVTGDPADRGRQSTAGVPADIAADVGAGSWP